MICENQLTVQHDVFVAAEQDGGPGKSFRSNNQFKYKEIVNIARVTETPTGIIENCKAERYFLYPIFTYHVGDNPRIEIQNRVVNVQTGVITSIEAEVCFNGACTNVVNAEYNLVEGENEFIVSYSHLGSLLMARFVIELTEGNFTNLHHFTVLPNFPAGSDSPVASSTLAEISAQVDYGDGNIEPLTENYNFNVELDGTQLFSWIYHEAAEHQYSANNAYVKEYFFEVPGFGRIYTQELVVVTDCVNQTTTTTKPCCPVRNYGKYFRVECGDYSYLIHESDAFISAIPIDEIDQDFDKKRTTVIRQDDSAIIGPDGDYSEFTWRPDIARIYRGTNNIPM